MDIFPLGDMIPDWIEALIVIIVIVLPLCVAVFGCRYGRFDD